MIGGTEWENLKLAGAFVLGAAFATIAVIRIVRAITGVFGPDIRRGRHAPQEDADQES